MLKSKNTSLLLMILPFLILSCWGDSSPTSDKARTYKVSGVVADKNGSGISGVAVQITGTTFSASDTSDADGAFSCEGLKSGDYKVKAHKDSCFFKPASIEIAVANTDIDTIKFLSADNCIHGRLLDIITDKPACGVMVMMKPISKTPDTTTTDSNGEYWFFDKIKAQYHFEFDLPLNKYSSSYHDTFIDSSIYPSAFMAKEIIMPDYHVSFEKLKFTKAVFSKETKNFTLEWTASKSDFSKGLRGYMLCIQGSPYEFYSESHTHNSFSSNTAVISLNDLDYFKGLWDGDNIPGEIYFIVCPWYGILSEFFNYFESFVWSDQVSVRFSL